MFKANGTRLFLRPIEADALRLSRLAGSAGHQGVVARVEPVTMATSLDDLLDGVQGPPLLLPTSDAGRGCVTADAHPYDASSIAARDAAYSFIPCDRGGATATAGTAAGRLPPNDRIT